MAKTMNIELTYDAATRELRAEVTLNQFIAEAPDQVITGLETQSLSLFKGDTMTNVDMQAVTGSVARALRTANVSLAEWHGASLTLEEADQLLASSIDPVGLFEGALNPPEPPAP